MIENPGAFPEGVTEKNIITYPSTPRNKLMAETLQRLKYVQRTGQGVDIIFREMISSGKPYPQYHAYNEAIKSDVEYTQYKTIQFIKAKSRILDYLEQESSITNEKFGSCAVLQSSRHELLLIKCAPKIY